VSEFPDARRVVLELADLRRLTVLERARACAVANVAEREIGPLLRAVTSRKGEPAELERAVLLLYAIAYQLGRRREPALTWEETQGWDLALDLDKADPVAEAEAHASVEAGLATGLPPGVAGDLTLAQLDAYREIRAEAGRGSPNRATRRRARVRR
jgi:hypothetical protein